MYFLLMPFLYLYIRSLCYENFHLKAVELFHVLPFGVFALFSLLTCSLDHTGLQADELATVKQHIGQVEFWSHSIGLHLQILAYLVASAVVLTGYRRQLRDLFSSIERIDLHWCNFLLAGFAAMWLLDVLNWISSIPSVSLPTASYWTFISSLLVNLAFTLVITYNGLAQSGKFSGIQGLPKYAASRLKPSDCDVIVKKLTELMETDRPYLVQSLSVEDLSEKLNVPVRNLSQAIHTFFNQNFYDFINSYRIDEIKRRINDERYRDLTLLAIAYDSGFNTKSVFNAAFKKHTGMTPREYKRQQPK